MKTEKEKKAYIKEQRSILEETKNNLMEKLTELEVKLTILDNLEKPYVAVVQSYSGGGQMAFKTLEKAEAKLEEYKNKTRFKNGLNYGVYLYEHLEDGNKKLLKVIPLQSKFRFPKL